MVEIDIKIEDVDEEAKEIEEKKKVEIKVGKVNSIKEFCFDIA